jgi:cytochrome c peroxidase
LAKFGVDPGQAVSRGFDHKPGGRNSPTVYNAGLQFVQFWDGRAASLAAQASGPMMNPVEMGMPGAEAVLAYVHSNVNYVNQLKQAYPGQKNPVTMENVTDAIASFEGRLLTPARWDEYLKGNQQALSEDEKEGLRVYLRSGCASCHAGAGLGGNSYAKLGVSENWPDLKSDTGRMALTHQERDLMYFKVPLLRNVVQTGPWFHNGNVQTIDEAVRLMGKHQLGLDLTASEVTSIVAFLNSLTGPIPQSFIEPPSQQKAAARIDGLKPEIDLRVNAAAERGE